MITKGREPLRKALSGINFGAIRHGAAWASAAFIAIVVAVYTAESDSGSRRLEQAFSGSSMTPRTTGQPGQTATPVVAQIPAGASELDKLTRRLNDTVQALASERQKLSERVAALEHSLDDITGAIRKPASAPARPAAAEMATAAPAPAPQFQPMVVLTTVPPLPQGSPAGWPATQPATPSPAMAAAEPTAKSERNSERSANVAAERQMTTGSVAPAKTTDNPANQKPADDKPDAKAETRPEAMAGPKPDKMPGVMANATQAAPPVPLPPSRVGHDVASASVETSPAPTRGTVFGVDLGGARSIDALTIHWSSLRAKFRDQLGGLQPVVAIRERKPGMPELRLIAGPLPDEKTVTELCMAIVAARLPCRPSEFYGQRLVLR